MKSLKSDRLHLRPLTYEDGERIEELAGDYEVAKTTSNIPHPYPKGGGKAFILASQKAIQQEKLVLLGVVENASEQLIGVINLNLSPENNRGEFGYFIGKNYWGKGFGTEAARLLLQYGFEELKLNRIYAAAFKENRGSSRVMEKIGLLYEGTFHQHLQKDGMYCDVVYYGLTKVKYLQKNSRELSK